MTRYTVFITSSNLDVQHQGHRIRATECGVLEVTKPNGQPMGEALSLGHAKRMVEGRSRRRAA